RPWIGFDSQRVKRRRVLRACNQSGLAIEHRKLGEPAAVLAGGEQSPVAPRRHSERAAGCTDVFPFPALLEIGGLRRAAVGGNSRTRGVDAVGIRALELARAKLAVVPAFGERRIELEAGAREPRARKRPAAVASFGHERRAPER